MPMINQMAPAFSAQAVYDAGEVKQISLEDFKGQWVVLFFYPLNFTHICPTEVSQFREFQSKFQSTGATVLGCSVDSVHAHKRWLRDDLGNLGFGLISDITKDIARNYGVLIEDRGFATRATFIIDPGQKIQYIGIHNTSVGRSVDEILRVLSACQSGQPCQAGWKQGEAHLTPLK